MFIARVLQIVGSAASGSRHRGKRSCECVLQASSRLSFFTVDETGSEARGAKKRTEGSTVVDANALQAFQETRRRFAVGLLYGCLNFGKRAYFGGPLAEGYRSADPMGNTPKS